MRKTLFVLLAVFLGVSLVLTLPFISGCGRSPVATTTPPDDDDPPDDETPVIPTTPPPVVKHTSYQSISLGATKASVLSSKGTPNYENLTTKTFVYSLASSYLNIRFNSSDRVIMVYVQSTKLTTALSTININFPLSAINDLLGTPSHTDTADTSLLKYYYNTRNMYLEIATSTNKVYGLGIYDSAHFGF